MKNFIFLLLILTIAAFLLLPRVGNILNFQETHGFLKIESIPEGASVFVDEKQVGATPVVGIDVSVGVHKVRLLHNSFFWEGKVETANNTETFIKRILGPNSAFSSGVIISYQKTKNGSNNPGLAITAKPEGVKVFFKEEEYQAPVVLDKVSAGKHKLKFVLDGY